MTAIRKALGLLALAIVLAAVSAPAFAQSMTSAPSTDQGVNTPLFPGLGSGHDRN
jgi:hypothetical protein